MSRPLTRPSKPIAQPITTMTEFTRRVLLWVQSIPKGKVASYGQIALLAGRPHGARGVAWILNSYAKSHALPWQRVINSQGKISFPLGSKEYQKQKSLLLKENIKFRDNDSIDLKKYGWSKKPTAPSRPKNRPKMFSKD